jgi:hypothetical protein
LGAGLVTALPCSSVVTTVAEGGNSSDPRLPQPDTKIPIARILATALRNFTFCRAIFSYSNQYLLSVYQNDSGDRVIMFFIR